MKVVGLGGTLRPGSSTERAVVAVLQSCARKGADVEMFGGGALQRLPHFDPSANDRTDGERLLVEAARTADAIVIGSPGYHGGVSGLVKNAIDLLEDLRDDSRPYFEGRPVGLVVSAAGWQAAGITLTALRGIVHAMRGWPTPIGIAINSTAQRPFGVDGTLADDDVSHAIEVQANQIMSFVLQPVLRSVHLHRDD